MAEALAVVLEKATKAETTNSANEQLRSIIESDFRGTIEKLYQIMIGETYSANARYMAIITLWQNFSIEPSKQENIHKSPFDIFPEEYISSFMESAYSFIGSQDQTLSNLSANLFGKVASIFAHNEPESGLITRLANDLASSTAPERVDSISVALREILSNFSPEEEEVNTLLNAIFGHLTTSKSAVVCSAVLSILVNIAENLTEVLQDENSCTLIVDHLLGLSTIRDMQKTVFDCWYAMAKFYPPLLAEVSDTLIISVIDALANNEDKETQLSACRLLKKLAKLEILDSEERMDAVEKNLQVIELTLINICCSIESPEPDATEAWEPHIAALHALELAVRVDTEHAITYGEEILTKFPVSENFAEREASLCLLSAILPYSQDNSFFFRSLETLMTLAGDQSARVRAKAIKCIGLGIERALASDQIPQELGSTANGLTSLSSALNDAQAVASEACNLLSILTKVPGFSYTSVTLSELFNRAIINHKAFLIQPFTYIDEIISSSAEPSDVLQLLPKIIDTLATAIQEEEKSCLIPELGEAISAYGLRFGNQLSEYAQKIISLLLKGAKQESMYRDGTFIPLGVMAAIVPLEFNSVLEEVLALLIPIIQDASFPDLQFSAASAFYLVLTAGFEFDERAKEFLNIFMSVLGDMTIGYRARRALVQCVAGIAEFYPQAFSKSAKSIFKQIGVFTSGLLIQETQDKDEAQLMAKAIADTFCYGMKSGGAAHGPDAVSIALKFTEVVAEMDITEGSLMVSVLSLMEYLAAHSNYELLVQIQDSPDVGDLISTTALLFEEAIPLRKKVLELLHYEEEDA